MTALRAGPNDWQPSAAVVAAGNAARTVYRNPPRAREIAAQYRTATRTQLPIGRGTAAVSNFIASEFHIATIYLPGRRRVLTGDDMLDMHQAGRAADYMADRAQGNAVAEWFITHANEVGTQFVVWRGNRWSAGQPAGRKWAPYEGSVRHDDHPHVELTPDGANGLTPWFQGRQLPSVEEVHEIATTSKTAPYADAGSFVDEHGKALVIGGAVTGGVLLTAGIVYTVRWAKG